jgi:hypothetical protein
MYTPEQLVADMSIDQKQVAELPAAEQHEEVDPDEIRAVEETFGTIVVSENETDPRRTLRPVPSLDPNDPLVGRLPPLTIMALMFVFAELAFVAKIHGLPDRLFLHVPFDGKRKQL